MSKYRVYFNKKEGSTKKSKKDMLVATFTELEADEAMNILAGARLDDVQIVKDSPWNNLIKVTAIGDETQINMLKKALV